MFKNEKEVLDHLLIRRNSTVGTKHLEEALAFYGNPHLALKSIQIAGTNGKGSTAYYLSRILEREGFKVGLFTSPHLVTHRDRIRINETIISQEDFVFLANLSYPLWDLHQLSMFEIDFLIASLYFLHQDVDYAIFEVGLGGRLDASSVLIPKVQAITNVSYDHMQFLGNSLTEIANEKAAIFKKDVPVFTQEDKREVLNVFDQWAEKRGTDWKQVPSFEYQVQGRSYDVSFKDHVFKMENEAFYQIKNFTLALEMAEFLLGPIDNVQSLSTESKWKGRFEWMNDHILIDGAHNLEGVELLLKSLQLYQDEAWTILYAGLKDKDYQAIIQKLSESCEQVFVTSFDFPRALKKEDYQGLGVHFVEDWPNFLKNKKGNKILVTGSLYFISKVRAYFED